MIGPAVELSAQQRRLEVVQLELAAQAQELVVAARRGLQATPWLDLGLAREPLANRVVRQREPGRVEQVEVVGEDRRVVTALQRMVREEDVERAASIEHLDVGDDPLERHVVAEVAIDAVQAGGTAGDVVGLLLDDEAEAGQDRSCGRTFALALGAHGTAVSRSGYAGRRRRSRQTTASCRSRPARSRPSPRAGAAGSAARCAARRAGGRASWVCADRPESSSESAESSLDSRSSKKWASVPSSSTCSLGLRIG